MVDDWKMATGHHRSCCRTISDLKYLLKSRSLARLVYSSDTLRLVKSFLYILYILSYIYPCIGIWIDTLMGPAEDQHILNLLPRKAVQENVIFVYVFTFVSFIFLFFNLTFNTERRCNFESAMMALVSFRKSLYIFALGLWDLHPYNAENLNNLGPEKISLCVIRSEIQSSIGCN